MVMNPLIAMQGETLRPDIAVASGLQAYNQGQQLGMAREEAALRNPILQAQGQAAQQAVESGKMQQFNDEQKSVIQGSATIKQFLDAGDTNSAATYLQQRRADLAKYGVSTSQTDQALQLLQEDPTGQKLKSRVDAIVAVGLQSGLLAENNGVFAPQAAFDANGNPVFIQGSKSGGVSQLPGYRPYTPTLDEQTRAAIAKAQGIAPINIAEAGGKRAAEAAVDIQTKPQIEAATTTAKATAEDAAKRNAGIIKSITEEKEIGRILDLAEPLMKDATESLAGTAIDAAGRVVGMSSKGAKAAAQLKTLEGALIMKMPRMEGPQSNMDQQLYRQMAAQIGDSTVPEEQRRAAMAVLRDLNSRYTGGQKGKYKAGDIIEHGGQRYRVTGGDPNDPDVEPIQ